MKTSALELKQVYISKEFEEKFSYDGILGAFLDEKGAHVLLWSPMASYVRLRFYEDGDKSPVKDEVEMTLWKNGVWRYDGEASLEGLYYDFEVEIDGVRQITGDPYAKSVGVNGHRSQILDLSTTNPDGWEDDVTPEKEAEDIICEVNIHDFSWDEKAGFSDGVRGTFRALAEDTYDSHKNYGLSHLKKLGVNTIQLMPMFDFASVDEAGSKEQFNWGYDPMNYNVPEGSFSTDPYHGKVRIKECKEMILNLHRMGFRVIMDVVYNHTYDLDSPLQRSCPWYFYRVDANGNPSNGSACGNDVATEMPMCKKYIVDSVLYWAREYHIDGFRFDLMGLMDVECANAVRKALDEVFGVGEKTVYGEPWKAGETFLAKDKELLTKENLSSLAPGIGAFSDDIRDGVKGSVFEFKEGGFVNGGKGFEKRLAQLAGSSGEEASRRVTYVSCHDNHTLWDKLCKTTSDAELRLKEYKLAAALYMLLPGRVFFLSGEEFCRSKDGEENSYNLPLSVNAIRWENANSFSGMVKYYKQLIALRKSIPALCKKEGESAVKKTYVRTGIFGFLLEDRNREIWCLFNARKKDYPLHLKGDWKIMLSTEETEGKVIPAKSAIVLSRDI